MNSKSIVFPLLVFVGGLLGFCGERMWTAARDSQQYSAAGQTLADLSRALEVRKMKTGTYPESIAALHVDSTSGDFSAELLAQVVYRKTADGYIAFVATPGVVAVEPGKSLWFE